MSTALHSRCVEAETLDHLREDDPEAIRSRHDLRRINRIMGNMPILDSLLNDSLARPPLRIAELGAGDGSLLLRLAKRRARSWPGVTLTLGDRQDLLSARTRAATIIRVTTRLSRISSSTTSTPMLWFVCSEQSLRSLNVSWRVSRGERVFRCWAVILSGPSAPTL